MIGEGEGEGEGMMGVSEGGGGDLRSVGRRGGRFEGVLGEE